ncbi:uncharacterized protein SOCEGT47_044550 [Sorangium cellulosum]|uniref:Uncharacterized protein n=1 Tax=Sorangium cellulosum TaxID=56 RepID=A0A4P2Q3M5_SORCE|nr:uncharacterized protein SOCEGT47_044550 [Sorangium cellulosum]
MGVERPSRRGGEAAATGLPGALPSDLGFVTESGDGAAREARTKNRRGAGVSSGSAFPCPAGFRHSLYRYAPCSSSHRATCHSLHDGTDRGALGRRGAAPGAARTYAICVTGFLGRSTQHVTAYSQADAEACARSQVCGALGDCTAAPNACR